MLISCHEAENSWRSWGTEKNRCTSENDSEFVVEWEEDAGKAEPDDGENAVAEYGADASKRDEVPSVVRCCAHQFHEKVHEDDRDKRQAINVAEDVFSRIRNEQEEGERQIEWNWSGEISVAKEIFWIIGESFFVEWVKHS